MASIVGSTRVSRGRKRKYFSVQFSSPVAGQPRKALYIGFVSRSQAEFHRALVNDILQYWNPTQPLPRHITARLDLLSQRMRAKYERAGLCGTAQEVRSLNDLIDHFIKHQQVTAATRETYKQATASLREVAGGETPLAQVGPALAARWRSAVAKTLAEATCAKRTNVLKAMFAKAVELGWITRSPFLGIQSGSQVNDGRLQYVRVETIDRVIDSVDDVRWKALIALARYAGLRVPSEPTRLRWDNVDLGGARLTVFAQKTQRMRHVPIRAPLMAILRSMDPPPNSPNARLFPGWTADSNLGTEFLRILARAGVEPWPRLFQNLRASAATDWVQRYPPHEVAAWLGHTKAVAERHYLVPLSANMADAATW